VKLLVLASRHVYELLTYAECAEIMREALAERARGQIQQPLRTIVRPRDAAGFMVLMPSYSPGAGYGLKAICVTPGNPAVGKDAHQGGVLLFDVSTGEPRALVNASAVTEIRTAATARISPSVIQRRRMAAASAARAPACVSGACVSGVGSGLLMALMPTTWSPMRQAASVETPREPVATAFFRHRSAVTAINRARTTCRRRDFAEKARRFRRWQ